MANPLIVEEWMKKADDDFRFAESNLKSGSEFYAQMLPFPASCGEVFESLHHQQEPSVREGS